MTDLSTITASRNSTRARALDAALELLHGQTVDIDHVLKTARAIEAYLDHTDGSISSADTAIRPRATSPH